MPLFPKAQSTLLPSLEKIRQYKAELQKANNPDEPGDVNEVLGRKVHPTEQNHRNCHCPSCKAHYQFLSQLGYAPAKSALWLKISKTGSPRNSITYQIQLSEAIGLFQYLGETIMQTLGVGLTSFGKEINKRRGYCQCV